MRKCRVGGGLGRITLKKGGGLGPYRPIREKKKNAELGTKRLDALNLFSRRKEKKKKSSRAYFCRRA